MFQQIFSSKPRLVASIWIALNMPSAAHDAFAADGKQKLRNEILTIIAAVTAGDHQSAFEYANQRSVAPCLKYLLSASAIGTKNGYRDTDLDEFHRLYDVAECENFTGILLKKETMKCDKECSNKECERRGFPFCSNDPVCDECSAAKALPGDEVKLYKLLTDNGVCDAALVKIRQQSRQFNDEPHRLLSRRNDMIGRALLGAAVPPLVAGSLLFGLSYVSQPCYGSEPMNLDGKAPTCVYPDNYKIGAPILWGIGLGLGIAGTVYQVKKLNEKAKIGALVPADTMRAKCPAPLPPAASPAQGGAP